MTKEEISAMEAGEELDKLIAVEVMAEPAPKFIPEDALELQLVSDPVKSPRECWLCLCEYDQGDVPIWRPLPFSTDISAALQVVEKGLVSFRFDPYRQKAKWTFFNPDGSRLIDTDNFCEWICKAALLAKEDK